MLDLNRFQQTPFAYAEDPEELEDLVNTILDGSYEQAVNSLCACGDLDLLAVYVRPIPGRTNGLDANAIYATSDGNCYSVQIRMPGFDVPYDSQGSVRAI